METIKFVGKINPPALRDAIHIPVYTARSEKTVWSWVVPVGVGQDGVVLVVPAESNIPGAGIVDPFLDNVSPGNTFLVFVPPGKITSLVHTWEHPDIDKKLGAIDVVARICNTTTKKMLNYMRMYTEGTEWFYCDDKENEAYRGVTKAQWRAAWEEYKSYGNDVPQFVDENPAVPFTCSC